MISSTILHSYPSFKFHPFLKHPSHAIPLKPYPPISNFRNNNHTCAALFTDDAPFAAAIGACMFTSLLLPVSASPEDNEDADSAVTTTDARLAVMGILSFIPYFNWLSWVFAWLDTGKRRYAVYAVVYMAPYLRSNLSLSPEESWLPIASILFCIVHIQEIVANVAPIVVATIWSKSPKTLTFDITAEILEASIRNGDIQGFQLFRNVADQLSSNNRKKSHLNQHQEMAEEGSKKEKKNLPHAQERSRDIGGWEDSQMPLQPRQHLNEDLDDDDKERSKH